MHIACANARLAKSGKGCFFSAIAEYRSFFLHKQVFLLLLSVFAVAAILLAVRKKSDV